MPETNSSKHKRQAVSKSMKRLGPESQAWDSRVLLQEVTLPGETHLVKPKPGAKYQLWALSPLQLCVSQKSQRLVWIQDPEEWSSWYERPMWSDGWNLHSTFVCGSVKGDF